MQVFAYGAKKVQIFAGCAPSPNGKRNDPSPYWLVVYWQDTC